MVNVNNFKPGITFLLDNQVYVVIEAQHSKQGRGQASVKAKVKDLRTGSIIMKTFTGGDKVYKAHIEKKPMNYIYKDQNNIFLMDNDTYEQITLPLEKFKWQSNFLVEGTNVTLRMFNDEIIDFELPINVEIKVMSAPEAIKGNTQNNPQKKVILESNFELEVPMFIKEGEKIIVSSMNGKYVGRGK